MKLDKKYLSAKLGKVAREIINFEKGADPLFGKTLRVDLDDVQVVLVETDGDRDDESMIYSYPTPEQINAMRDRANELGWGSYSIIIETHIRSYNALEGEEEPIGLYADVEIFTI